MLFYPPFQPRETESPIVNFYLNKPYGVWVVVNVENKLGPSSHKASLNVILDGMKGLEKMAQDSDDLIRLERSDISYNHKHNQIVFRNEDYVKQFTVQRYVGKPLTKGKFKDWINSKLPISGFTFFDYSRNRINLILGETPNTASSQESTITPSSHSHTSS